ncbi:uncharacterized protein TOT_010000739 [Theileria orientalis strain Shintoku]|uniref:Bromo domain-containing protein n=1 Tax=Theileria orientalis strain Shintoku TaxID=869250 RepID=J4D608_THEOR|nr:uncharacterized protein TOT_010000739 [Theileria orientalis strain Shintoku]BAM39280.1 uncharacterized protein TOT_010000739 [Theileria orientalis strain Shintoku]|eukprot:XP_009689581.1 uncharacterized protein TOT_010000739 [Theileria orientalis strain Shintoku]
MTTYHENYLNNPLVKALMTGTLAELKEVLKSKYESHRSKAESTPKDAPGTKKEEEGESQSKVAEKTLEELVDENTKITPLCQLSHKSNEESLEIAKLLVETYTLCNPNHVDLIGQTCLFYAARDGRGELCSYFSKHGCNPNHKDRLGQTCTFYAARDGHAEVIKVLLEHGADVNIIDTNSQTCLFYAARDGRVDVVKLLLENNINYSWKDLQRRTALSFAKSKGHNEIVSLLKKSSSEKSASAPQPKRTLESELSGSFEPDPFSGVPVVSGDVLSKKPKRYRLQFRPFPEDDKLWLDAPLVKVQEFEMRFPELAKWDKEAAFPPTNALRNPLLKQWYSLAQNLLSSLLKQEGGYVFDKPVDAKKQNCPDYYDIIKKPMSFSCIRGKLRKYTYTDPQEFVDDVLLIFENCAKYNKPETWVATVGNNLRDFFKQQLVVLGFEDFCKKEKLVKELLEKSQIYISSKNPEANHVEKPTVNGAAPNGAHAEAREAPDAKSASTGKDGAAVDGPATAPKGEPRDGLQGSQDPLDVKAEQAQEIEI